MEQEPNRDSPLHIGKPEWLKTPLPSGSTLFKLKRNLRDRKLFTVCEEAKCPNMGECWNHRSATFMIMGDVCTRACRFCHVKTGNPQGWLDPNEPQNIAQSCVELGLKYVVITMVDRDDLEDGGALHISRVVTCIKQSLPEIKVELLAGDMNGRESALETILEARPEVFAHNLETVESLSRRVRDARANYRQSLNVLQRVKSLSKVPIFTKSGLMLGLGESFEQVVQTLEDLRSVDVDFITLGQYMRPTKQHLSIKRWVTPGEFDELGFIAQRLGFKGVASAPLVRSSYRAHEFYLDATKKIEKTI